MKRWIAIIMILMTFVHFTACQKEATASHRPAFYYCTADLSYSMDSTTIQAEYRENTKKDTLQQKLVKYFAGPSSAELRSPFPAGLKLVAVSTEGKTVYITVSDALASLSGLELTLACGCIALTCLDLTGADEVVINARNALLDGQKSITMDRNTLLLLDTVLEGE